MKIAIIGTRGIPNHYGGFEQYAELLSVFLAKKKWDVTVYSSSRHPYKEKFFQGVRIKRVYDPEYRIGTAGQFVYDWNCIWDIRTEVYDVIYQLGYTSSALFGFLLPGRSVVVTNMDGMEWQRAKYSRPVRLFLKYSEKLAVHRSDYLIADALPVQDYLRSKYGVESFYSAYTASIPDHYDKQLLAQYGLKGEKYALLIARMEPENNIEMVIRGFQMSRAEYPLIIVGGTGTAYGKRLRQKYESGNIRFIGSVYDKKLVDTLRACSLFYFHGHSVGGTNPSLLEAMACGCLVVAHDNVFNRSVLGEDALYFKSKDEICAIVNRPDRLSDFEKIRNANLEKVKTRYSECAVFEKLENLFTAWVIRKTNQ